MKWFWMLFVLADGVLLFYFGVKWMIEILKAFKKENSLKHIANLIPAILCLIIGGFFIAWALFGQLRLRF